jgi:hypothetical protein
MSIRRGSQRRLGRPSAVIAGATVTDSTVSVISRRHLGEVLEHRVHHVRRQPSGGGPVGQLAVVQREDLATGPLDPLDHLQLHLQRAHQPVEIGDDDVVGLTGLDHLDGPEQAGALDERALARDVDLGEMRDEPLAALTRPPLGALELHVRRVEVLPGAVALGADTHDGYSAGLLVTAGSSRSAGIVKPFRGIRHDRREGQGREGTLCRRWGCGAYTQPRDGKATRAPTTASPASRARSGAAGLDRDVDPDQTAPLDWVADRDDLERAWRSQRDRAQLAQR